MQGDLRQREMDYSGALDAYEAAVCAIGPDPTPGSEQHSTLSVSHSKAGDACIWLSRLSDAQLHYSHCVSLRRAALALNSHEPLDTAAIDATLNVTVSLAKLHDCLQARTSASCW